MDIEEIRDTIINEDLDFDAAIDLLIDNDYGDYIYSWDVMKELIKDALDQDDMNMVQHLVNAIWNDDGVGDAYWVYDRSMGTLETPRSLGSVDDVIDYIDGFLM